MFAHTTVLSQGTRHNSDQGPLIKLHNTIQYKLF